MTKELRKLNNDERAVIEKLLEPDIYGKVELHEQLSSCQVYDHDDGSGTIFFVVDRPFVRADVTQRIPVEAAIRSKDKVIDILLHVVEGELSELEFVIYKDDCPETPISINDMSVIINQLPK